MSKQTDLINIPDAITVSGSNVGIGTSSPSEKLHVQGDGADILLTDLGGGQTAKLGSTGSNNGLLELNNSSHTSKVFLNTSGDSYFNGGNVGIGISSPEVNSKLHVKGASSANLLIEAPTDNASLTLQCGSSDTGLEGAFVIFTQNTTAKWQMGMNTENAFRWYNYNTSSEAMRIDSAGFVVIGATAQGSQNAVTLSPTGHVQARKASGAAGFFDRLTNDGTIIQLRKSGADVGSIGVLNSNNLTISGTVADHGGLQFGTHCVIPMEANVDSDGTINLGSSNSKFKDAYLSGGVYLGGTGSANKLDDVEYGTYSLADATTGNLTFTVRYAVYKKVGQLVHVEFDIDYPSTSNGANARITIPFTTNVTYFSGIVGWSNNAVPIKIHGASSGAYFMDCGNSGGGNHHLSNANLSSKRLIGSFSFCAT